MKISNKNIGSERIASALGTVNDLGLLCEQSGIPEPEVIDRMNQKVMYAEEYLRIIYDAFEKDLVLGQPLFYGREVEFICDNHDYTKYAPFWYHPDHLGSSSYITNLSGEINQHMEYLPFGELLVEEHLNSYNSPFKFNAKEFDAETGNYYYGARYYDPKWSLWLSVDPLWEKYPSWSPFAYTFQNSINFIDPDGRSGEPVIDNENKTVTIHSKLYFYGSEANSELSEKIATGIASQWNSANAKTEVEGIEYDVKFRISYETVSVEKAIELAENNKSLKNNFIRVEKGDKNQSSFALASEQGGNSFWFNTNDELESSTTPAHEYGHGLGLPHPKIDLSESADRPHIMIPRNKAYGSYWSIENDKGRRVVNPNARRVTPQNVSDALKNNGGRIHNRIISKDGKLY